MRLILSVFLALSVAQWPMPTQASAPEACWNFRDEDLDETISACQTYHQTLTTQDEDYVEISANMENFHNKRSRLREDKGDLQGAIADLGETIRHQKALDAYYRADKTRPTMDFNEFLSTYYERRAALYQKIGEIEGAIADFNSAIAETPFYASGYYGLANLYREGGENQLAIETLDRAISAIPLRNPSLYNYRGYLYLMQDAFDRAQQDFKLATLIDPKSANFRHSLGEAQYYQWLSLAENEPQGADVYQHWRKAALETWQEVCTLAGDHQTRSWQEALTKLGHFSGETDGTCDDRMIEAFEACSKAKCQF